MTYYGGKELAAAFRTVRNNTIKIAEEIPEAQYDFRAAPGIRSVAQTLVHIAFAPAFQLNVHQNGIDDLAKLNFGEMAGRLVAEEARPRSKSEIIELLKIEGNRYAEYAEGLSESFLSEQVAMPAGAQPAAKSRFEMLLSPKEHEMHHRGQLMVMERMLGLVPHLTREFQERMAAAAQRAQA
jgi:uncharacterized damage-inducible protein DinB